MSDAKRGLLAPPDVLSGVDPDWYDFGAEEPINLELPVEVPHPLPLVELRVYAPVPRTGTGPNGMFIQ